MKGRFYMVILLLQSITASAQINFEPGYYVDNNGNRIEGMIKNMDWRYNPTMIEFKSSSEEVQVLTIDQIQEFEITNYSKYVRFNVKMDRTSKNVNEINENPDPVFKEEILLLKTLFEGQANLFEYVEGNLIRYFLQMEGQDIQQLIYKKYKNEEGVVVSNQSYKNQLWRNLYCVEISEDDLQRVTYTRRSLMKYLTRYSRCKGIELTDYHGKSESDRKQYRLTVRPGVTFITLTAGNPNTNRFTLKEYEYESKVGFRIGLENEYILAVNRNKWSILLEPTYQSYSTEEDYNGEPVSVDYSSIEIPIGLRYYMYLNDNQRIFANFLLAFDVTLNNELIYPDDNEFETKTGPYMAFGAGYSLNNKFDIELRYTFNRDLLSDYVSWEATYSTIVFTVGYSLF